MLPLDWLLFSCCSLQATPPYLLGWQRRGRSRSRCSKAAAEPISLPSRPPHRGLPERLLHFPSSFSLLPLFLSLPGFSPRRHLRGFLGGATQLARKGGSGRSAKVLPASAGASPQPSPDASLSLGCAKCPLMVRFSCRTVPRPCKVLAPQTLELAVGTIPCGGWPQRLSEPWRILNSQSLLRDLKPNGSQGPV